MVGLFENIFNIPAGIKAIPVSIRAMIDKFFPVPLMMEGPTGPSDGMPGSSRGEPAGGTSGPPRTKIEHDKLANELLASLRDSKTELILHPDIVKQAKAAILRWEQIAATRDLTRDEMLSLTVHRRGYSQHKMGLA